MIKKNGVPEILVEVSAGSSGDLSAHPSSPDPFSGRADELSSSIAEIAAKLRPRVDTGIQVSENDGWSLNEVQIWFDVSLAVDTGVLVAKSTGTGTFTVRLSWGADQ